jgi:hypothetical protein
MITLSVTENEARLLGDVLQMWMEGIESEVEGLTTSEDDESHWSKHQLRKQFEMAGRVKMRIDLDVMEAQR